MFVIIITGFFGALSTIFGKMALSSNHIIEAFVNVCNFELHLEPEHCEFLLWILRGLIFGLMLLFNGLMINFFLKSMDRYSSIIVTVVSTATNNLLTGLLGALILKERVGLNWILGSIIIGLGIFFISLSQKKQ